MTAACIVRAVNPCIETSRSTNCLQNASVSLAAITWSPAAPSGALYASIQCVGNNITASTTKTVVNASQQVTIHYSNCPDDVLPATSVAPTTTDTYTVSGVVAQSGSGLSATFTSSTPGSGSVLFTSTATLNDSACGVDPPNPATVSGTYAFVAVDSLTPSEGTLIPGSSPPTYIVCLGTGDVTVSAGPNPSVAEAYLPACWTFTGGDAVGAGKTQRKVSKNTPSMTTFTCTAGSSTKTIKVVVLKTELKSIEFTSKNVVLKDNNTDYTDSGTDYAAPEWVLDPARNNPISHTKNSSITVKVTVKVQPAGVTFNLDGDGPNKDLDFESTGNSSTGGDQPITMTADSELPNEIATLSKSISWSLTASGVACNSWSSGPHTIYVTYGTPTGSVITEKRVNWACTIATGATSISGAAEKFRDAIAANPGFAVPRVWNLDSWQFLASGDHGDCITLAKLARKGLEMVGIPAQERWSFPTADGSSGWPAVSGSTCQSETTETFSYMGQSFNAKLVYTGNNFEAFFTVSDPAIKAYTVYPPAGPFQNQTYYYLEVLRSVTSDQFWVWKGTQTNGSVTVTDWTEVPGSTHIAVPAVP